MSTQVKHIKRAVLLNPGPATTTDTVKYAQVVTDICHRETDFAAIIQEICLKLTQIASTSEDSAKLAPAANFAIPMLKSLCGTFSMDEAVT